MRNPIAQIFNRYAAGPLARRAENRTEEYIVRGDQRCGEVINQPFQASEGMRLEYADDAPIRIFAAGRIQRRPNLGRMVSVIVNDDIGLPSRFREAPLHTAKGRNALPDRGHIQPEHESDADDSERIQHVMAPIDRS